MRERIHPAGYVTALVSTDGDSDYRRFFGVEELRPGISQLLGYLGRRITQSDSGAERTERAIESSRSELQLLIPPLLLRAADSESTKIVRKVAN